MKRVSRSAKFLPRLRVVCANEIALGPGKADLLDLIHETGSIREAARRLEMSYMRAWKLIQTMNACFNEPVILAERGGSARGGARLSESGQKALALYRRMEATCIEKNERDWELLSKLLRS